MDLEAYIDQTISSLQEEMNYLLAVKKWNQMKRTVNTEHVWAIPRKGSKEYEEVKEIANPKPAASPAPTPAPAPAAAPKSSTVKRINDSEVIIESEPDVIYRTTKDKPSNSGSITFNNDKLMLNINDKQYQMVKDPADKVNNSYISRPIHNILPRTQTQINNDAGYLYVEVTYAKSANKYMIRYNKDTARPSGARTYQDLNSLFIPFTISSDAREFLKK